MDFQATVNAGWARHAEHPDAVFDEALALVEHAPADGVAALANLVFHVGGEHLGRFSQVARALHALLPRTESAGPVHRLLAACALCGDDEAAANEHLSRAAGDPATNRGMVLGLVACALAARGRVRDAARHFEAAVALAEGAEALHRSIAVTGNNLAVSLEERAARSPEDDALLLQAARIARVYWEKAGTWMNVERAEYRLAAARLARGEPALAVEHAERVLAIVRDNGNDPGEAFFGWEILARARLAAGDHAAARDARDHAAACLPDIADEGFRGWCASSLAAVDTRLATPG